MRAGDLLDLWEQGSALGPVERALALAGAAGADVDALRHQSYGRTNDGVLAFRERQIGPDLAATASCPQCDSRVEFVVGVTDLRAQPECRAGGAVAHGEYVVDWRPPTPADLLAAAAAPHPGEALRRRCLAVAKESGEPADRGAVPADVLELAEAAMAEADPIAEVMVGLICPECGAEFESDLDLGSFVWAEIEARARRTLQEVDTLARAYGWTEAEVLGLTEARRSSYLRLVSGT